jgi:membrane carboxypeptidase/penicillin-binding protein
LITYDERHGFRGAIGYATVDDNSDAASLNKQLSEFHTIGELVPAIVLGTKNDIIGAYTKEGKMVLILKKERSLRLIKKTIPGQGNTRMPILLAGCQKQHQRS